MSRAGRPAPAARSSPVLVVGIRPDDYLGLALTDALSERVRFPSSLPGPDDDLSACLAIGVFPVDDDQGSDAFGSWARASRVPWLEVGLGPREARIGPLALPDRDGCGRCARQRLAAADAANPPPVVDRGGEASLPDHSAAVGRLLAREVRTIVRRGPTGSRLLDHLAIVDASTGTSSFHRVIPLPRCALCGGAVPARSNRKPAALSPDDPPEVVLAALAGWIDPRVGVISRLVVERSADDSLDLPIVATTAPPHVIEEDGTPRRLPLGWGKGLSLSGAILSAVGEAIERYSASLPDRDRIVWERPDDLVGERLDPRCFALYSDAQYARDGFPYARFDPAIRHPWVLGRWLGSDRPVWVPAVFAFLSLRVWREHLVGQGTSNGLAASTDPDDAALRATLELIERDALMVAWLSGCPGRRIRIDDALDPRLRGILDGLEALGATTEIYALPTSAVGTTVLGLARGDGVRWPGVTMGLAADLDPGRAVQQAILELGQTGPFLRRMMLSGALPIPSGPDRVTDLLHHAAYYFPPERAAAFDRLRGDEGPISLESLLVLGAERSLAGCAAALEAASIQVAVVDVTASDVALGPFRVARAVSPDLQPIWYGYGLDRQPVSRVRARGLAALSPEISPIW